MNDYRARNAAYRANPKHMEGMRALGRRLAGDCPVCDVTDAHAQDCGLLLARHAMTFAAYATWNLTQAAHQETQP